MRKILRKTRNRDTETAALYKKTAKAVGCSTRQVRRVIEGEQFNQKIQDTYMFLAEGEKNLLIQAVENLIPFN